MLAIDWRYEFLLSMVRKLTLTLKNVVSDINVLDRVFSSFKFLLRVSRRLLGFLKCIHTEKQTAELWEGVYGWLLRLITEIGEIWKQIWMLITP